MRRTTRAFAAGLLSATLAATTFTSADAAPQLTSRAAQVEQRMQASAQAEALEVSSFPDVRTDNQFYREITWIASVGITQGYGDGTYRPLAPVNRDTMAAFLYRLAGSPPFDEPATSPFIDIKPTTQFYKEMTWLHARGISTGWDEGDGRRSYRPLSPINRDAMAAFLYRLVGSPDYTEPAVSPFRDVTPDTLYYREMAWLASRGVSTGWDEGNGTRSYRPVIPIARDAMAAFLYRLGGWWPDRTFSGTGSETVMMPRLGSRYWIATITHNATTAANFEVYPIDSARVDIGPIVQYPGSYNGTVGLTSYFNGRKDVAGVRIKASGAWTIKVKSVETAPVYSGSGTYEGGGDQVVRVDALSGASARYTYSGSQTFVVTNMTQDGAWDTTAVESYGRPVNVVRPVPGNVYAVEVIGDGNWSISR